MGDKLKIIGNDNNIFSVEKNFSDNSVVVFCGHPTSDIITGRSLLIKKVEKFAELLGCDGYAIIFLFSKVTDYKNISLNDFNVDYFKSHLDNRFLKSKLLWAGWGRIFDDFPELAKYFNKIFTNDERITKRKWIRLSRVGTTNPPSPTLPGYKTPFENFELKKYFSIY